MLRLILICRLAPLHALRCAVGVLWLMSSAVLASTEMQAREGLASLDPVEPYLEQQAIATSIPRTSIDVKVLVYSEFLDIALGQVNTSVPCYEQDLLGWPHIANMEFALLCHALHAGGLDVNYELVPVPTQVRAIQQLDRGTFAIFGHAAWGYLDSERVYASSPVMPKGDFEKGLYISSTNAWSGASFKSLQDLRQLTAAVGSTWKVDRDLLDCLGFRQQYAVRYPQLLTMVNTHQADFLLQNFMGGDSLEQYLFGTTLMPIKGYKVILPDSLHFYVSRTHPKSERLIDALERGLKVLREAGDIKAAYQSAGFYNPQTVDWTKLMCE